MRWVCLAAIILFTACQPVNTTSQPTGYPTLTKTPYLGKVTPTPTKSLATASPEPTSQINVLEADLQKINIRFWHTYSGAEARLIDRFIQEFNQNNQWGIQVIPNYQGDTDNINELINNTIDITGNIPNITMGYSYQAQNWGNSREMVVDLEFYSNDSKWGISDDEINDYFQSVWNSDYEEGKRWGIPAWRTTHVIFYNQGWGRELGFKEAPRTTAQFKEQSCKASLANLSDEIEENDGTGGWLVDTNFSTTLNWIHAFGGQVIQEIDNSGYQLESPGNSQALYFLRNMYEEECSWLSSSQFPAELSANRQALFSTSSLSDIPFYEYEFSISELNDEWQVIPFPTKSTGTPIITLYGPSYVILAGEPEEQLASWIFIKWLIKPNRQAEQALAGYTLPLTKSARDIIRQETNTISGWQEIIDSLETAGMEPNHSSWSTVRWTVSDATKQLYQWYFEKEQIPTLLRLLDRTANEFYMQR